MKSSPAPRRRNPIQSRAEATLAAIREACLRILEQEGPDRLTTNRIAEVAGISIGSLYQYYADKHAIAADICNSLLVADLGELDRYTEQSLFMAKKSLDETLAFFIQEKVARHRKLYRQLKDFYLEIHWRYDFETYMLEHFPQRMTTADFLHIVLRRYREELAPRDFSIAATMVVNAIEGTIHATLDHNPEQILNAAFSEELLALVLGYLKHPPPLSSISPSQPPQ
ncbi:TetR family transcriptional regulator [Denitratisoma sp. DHT3]|uniref:TetR/AcrR family transcriptional regulator n=1 Tax=Denitratisoma sp. DHT3 TaxID=1981880 RepID=UPI0011989D2D|nr:TetR/AcrR family transcriptional regulator [Denitratisoma sp. DHT3]QDX81726.1 TetR family transcriptional regulator [Denitratisoma sp. DHT3]